MAKKTKRRKKHDEEMSEAWLLPYSDLLTLLLALFIVLFATSSVDAQKLAQLSAAFNAVFEGGSGVMDNPSPVDPTDPKTISNSKNSAYVEDQKSLSKIKGKVDDFIAVNELEKQFETKLTDEGLLVTIRDSVLFDPGKADVKEEHKATAKELSKLLVFEPKRNVVITGYTDNVPERNGEFSSNWELSVMRAVNFLTLIVDNNPKLDSSYFSAKGYGENKPIASNDTAENRAKNRRVEVLIQPLVKKDGTSTDPSSQTDLSKQSNKENTTKE
ncbi:flagellar motor protein MotB [Rummeliibacillus pycnus]|uniref:flagellar motor protein MotB n=1 Tax=Rummeliibacillus pycnus TaxID=101070 RepID=UPI003D2B7EF6